MIERNLTVPSAGAGAGGCAAIPGLPDGLWQALAFSGGDRIFAEGDPADALYVVDAGSVRIELERAELDSESVLAQVGAGEVFGEQGLLDGGRRSASAFAEGEVAVRRLTLEVLERLERDAPQVAAAAYRALGRSVSLKLRAANERYSTVAFAPRDPYVDEVVAEAVAAQARLAALSDEEVDGAIGALAGAVAAEAQSLAELTVAATRMGSVNDKTRKNLFASAGVAASMRGQVGVGLLDGPGPNREVMEIGGSAGVVFGLIPVTNPVATAIFKVLACLKSRNAVILSFPRRAAEVGERFALLAGGVLAERGIPQGAIHCVTRRSSRRMTEAFFRHAGVDLILATGGRSMVLAAYGSGKPAIGVGPGNAPVLVCADADAGPAAAMVVESKSFDCGLICGGEHNLVVVEAVRQRFEAALEGGGAAVLSDDEAGRFRQVAVTEDGSALRRRFLGRPADEIARAAGVVRPRAIRLVVVRAAPEAVGNGNFAGGEKMAPVLSLFGVTDESEGFALSRELLEREGRGHTAVIHTADRGRAVAFGMAMPASRILVNSPATQGVIGQTTGLEPSLVLGCGYYGGNSTGDNVGFRHLRNLKRLAFYHPPVGSP